MAVCALVVPGVSGSFLLLAVGLYSTTLGAVDARDLTYLVAFALGAVVGLGTFVRLLRWLLERHRRTTLLVMAGLMTGSLRALWPWQSGQGAATGTGSVVAPYDPVAGPRPAGPARRGRRRDRDRVAVPPAVPPAVPSAGEDRRE